ncbi:HTH-type transcriptional repressor ComR [bacterium MnTg02]|nr:HTH-type transcriptional repressor ComR [bacterium MnTg02]
MARPREFDEVQAMDSAVETFRMKGYEAASLMDLLGSMKLSKSSLYNSFGTKHELFLSAIDHYAIKFADDLAKQIETAPSIKEGVRRAFDVVVESSTSDMDKRGCLLMNSALEVLPQDEMAARRIAEGVGRIRKVFLNLIISGQARGELSQDRDVEGLADFITMNYMGLRAVGRVYPERGRLNSLVDQTVAAIS